MQAADGVAWPLASDQVRGGHAAARRHFPILPAPLSVVFSPIAAAADDNEFIHPSVHPPQLRHL